MTRPRGFELRAGEEWRDQHHLNRHAQRHAAAIIIAPPPSIGGAINTASGCVLGLNDHFYLLTANHVLSKFEERLAADATTRWQVSFPSAAGDRLVFDPRGRVAAQNVTEDIVAIELTGDEVTRVGVQVCSAPLGWPPPVPQPGDFLVLSGYPRMYREQDGSHISFPALSAVFEVATSGTHHVIWQWERDRMVNITGPDVPEVGSDLGGMSGGPVFLLQDLVYPLVGIITDFHSHFELLRVAHLGALRLDR